MRTSLWYIYESNGTNATNGLKPTSIITIIM